MIGTYAAVVAVCGASLAIGQAALVLCGARQWSWLSPAVGLALLCVIAWATVRWPGHGAVSALVVAVVAVASLAFLRGRGIKLGGAARGLPVALLALAAASLPFLAGGHFGILGTGFNPDMSQHLFAADRLAHGAGSQLLHQGYPMGPHAIVVALNEGLGIGLVEGFSGLTISVAVLAPLTALAAFEDAPAVRRAVGALLVGLPYVVASYFAQGAFKEVMQALFVLAFVLALRESGKPARAGAPGRFVPAALIAVGSVYTYSFPGLVWLGAVLVLWLLLERIVRGVTSFALRPALLAGALFAVAVLPELGRMVDFRNFETFSPAGPGLGNLFGQISPLEALGIWPSGDFRVAPGGGAVPAFAYYAGAALGLALLVYGLIQCWRRRETALIAGAFVGMAVYALARIDGTPYTAAKAIEIAAPPLTLAILTPLKRAGRLAGLAAIAYVIAAGVCSLLAFANAPVGPRSYSPALTDLRPAIQSGSTLVLAPDSLLEEEHGARYIAWELRGGRVCIEPEGSDASLRPGIRFVVTSGGGGHPPFGGLRMRENSPPYVLWERSAAVAGAGPCPLIAVRQARHGPAR